MGRGRAAGGSLGVFVTSCSTAVGASGRWDTGRVGLVSAYWNFCGIGGRLPQDLVGGASLTHPTGEWGGFVRCNLDLRVMGGTA